MEVEAAGWQKVPSKSFSGRYYYFNSKTGESSWTRPAQPGPPATGHGQQQQPQSSNVIYYSQGVPLPLESCSMAGSHDALLESHDPEYMDERWADDEELMMDVDMTTEMQQEVFQQVVGTRNSLSVTQGEVPTLLSTTTTEQVDYSDFLYLVIDTNILLSHLQFLAELKDCAIKGVGKPILVIPWVVMQELDSLKTASSSVCVKANKAIKFLHACFSGQHPRVRGQSMKEVHTEVSNLAIDNNDDRILHCCLVYQSCVSASGVVVLFSNDTQLCSKAIVNNVKAFNSKTLLSELRLLCRQLYHERGGAPVSYTHTEEYARRVEQQMRLESNRALIDDLTCEAESLLREGLSAIVQQEMSVAFGSDLWLQVVAIKPPWTFKDIVQLLDKHWIAVFGLVVGRVLKESVSQLSSYIKNKNSVTSSASQTNLLIEHGYKLLQAFSTHSKYGGVVVHSMASINVLHSKLKDSCEQPQPQLNPTHNLSAEEQLKQMATSPPPMALDQVPWVLGVVYDSLKLLVPRLITAVQTTGDTASVIYLSQLHTLLLPITSNLQILITTAPTPPVATIHDTVTSLSRFLNEVLSVANPLQSDALLAYCQASNLLILQKALTEYDSLLTSLQQLINN